MQPADPLIRTKLRMPFTRPGLVSRPRLQEQIALGLRGPLTLVTAPAGFGKTTLAATCLDGCGMPVAWLSLDKDDNREGRFLTYLIAALQAADPRVGGEAAQLMAGIQQAQPAAVLTSLVNDLDRLGVEIALVLDDYQLINSPAVHDGLAFLLEHQPGNLHLVIATRSDPPLPLARLRARAQMVELRAADLRFTPAEAAQFMNDVMGLRLDAGSVALLEDRTEGWIAGLQMAALSMRDRHDTRAFIEGFSGTNRHILDYLLEEILANQSPAVQRFLLATSILERLTTPLCDAITEISEWRAVSGDESQISAHDSRFFLEYLERENLFLIALDDERSWFRYHHLFSDLLRARLHQAQPDRVPGLHRRASTWLEENGFIPEAIHHLFAAREDGRAADLIEHYGPERWAESDPSVIQMADSLPPAVLMARPKIGIYLAWFFIIHGLVEKALPLLNDLEQQLAGAGPDSGRQWMQTVVRSALAFLGQRTSGTGSDLFPEVQALDEIPAEESILKDAADILYGMTLGRRGELGRAEEVAVRCIRRKKIIPGTQTIPTLVPFLARIYLLQGRLTEAVALCREYLDPIREKGIRFIYSAGGLDIILGEALYERNYLNEAEKKIRDGLQANEPWVDVMSDAFGQLALIRVLQARGDYAGGMQIVEKLETRLQASSRPHEFEEDFRTLRVRIQLESGERHSTFAWADQIQRSTDFSLHEEFYRFTLARVRLAQGRYAEVEEMLSRGAPPTESGNSISRQLESDLIRAAAVAGQGRLPEAIQIIGACLALAEPEGYVRAFLNGGEPVRELLTAYLRSDAPGHKLYTQKILDAFPPPGRAGLAAAQPGGLVEPLSARELEVLQLMALGRTNPEIARQLVVAAGTIKAHAASIFRKLDVANRTEAVTRARQLGILA